MSRHFFVTGIGTGVGKTIVSALLVAHYKGDYWKPIQSGDLDDSDSHKISLLTTDTVIHPEIHRLMLAASPHESAAVENIHITLDDFQLPATQNHLVIEGAGGLFVPINDRDYMIDLLEKLCCPAVLVTKDYLGTINHSILSIKALQQRGIPISLLVLNGPFNAYSAAAITNVLHSSTQVIHLPGLSKISQQHIQQLSQKLDKTLKNGKPAFDQTRLD